MDIICFSEITTYVLRFKKSSRSDLFKDFFNFWTQNQGLWWSVSLLNSSVYCSTPKIELVYKKFILIAFVYQKLLHGEISSKRCMINEFSFFPNFVVVWFFIFLQYSQSRTYGENLNLLGWIYQKLSPEKNWRKSLSDGKISRFLKFSTSLFPWKIECFPIKTQFSSFNHWEIWYRILRL